VKVAGDPAMFSTIEVTVPSMFKEETVTLLPLSRKIAGDERAGTERKSVGVGRV